jgi:hypothetical protein
MAKSLVSSGCSARAGVWDALACELLSITVAFAVQLGLGERPFNGLLLIGGAAVIYHNQVKGTMGLG